MQSVNLNYKPSFSGITRYLQREIYDVAKAQKPKPHWKPVLEEDMELYKQNITKAIKEAL